MTRDTSDISDKAQVFISYGRSDAERVLSIAQMLEDEGASVWRDGDRILGGQYYGEEIVHAIAHSRVVMLICSPHSFQSDNVHREVLLTWDYYHRRYIPVWLSPVTEIPERFRYCLVGCQWIDAHSQPPDRWLPQLLKALRAAGVETKVMTPRSGEAIPAPQGASGESDRQGPRCKPGDRPIRGADWELERLLGKGGFGEVWKAKNPDLLGLPVALKFCLQLDERSKGLLRHEADMVLRAQQQFRGSASGIVPLAHAYLNNDPPCLEYPYIEGGTLVRLIDEARQSTGSLKPAQAQQIVQRVAQIVSTAHRATPDVRITRPFYLGIYEVTQAQYQAITGQNPSWFSSTGGGKDSVGGQSTDQHPVENVSWLDAVKFCNLLSEKEGLRPFYEIEGETVRVPDWNATGYRLPTEAEWEYACRARSTGAYSFGDDPNQLGEYAWYDGNSKVNGNYCTHPVGRKRRNSFELHDMHGNVWEWCWDGYSENYYQQPTADDPRGPDGAWPRVRRGAGWNYYPRDCRTANRYGFVPADRGNYVGFRLALGQSGC